jgi:hypothetical protein
MSRLQSKRAVLQKDADGIQTNMPQLYGGLTGEQERANGLSRPRYWDTTCVKGAALYRAFNKEEDWEKQTLAKHERLMVVGVQRTLNGIGQ